MQRMDAPQLARYLQDANPLLLDVREPWEFEICQIDGSINIPMAHITQQLEQIREVAETVVICHHGVRSLRVIQYLQQLSIDSLINLDGGVDAWAREVDASMPVY
jgi:rhodanese-related sulfurtransferase